MIAFQKLFQKNQANEARGKSYESNNKRNDKIKTERKPFFKEKIKPTVICVRTLGHKIPAILGLIPESFRAPGMRKEKNYDSKSAKVTRLTSSTVVNPDNTFEIASSRSDFIS